MLTRRQWLAGVGAAMAASALPSPSQGTDVLHDWVLKRRLELAEKIINPPIVVGRNITATEVMLRQQQAMRQLQRIFDDW